MEEEGRFAQENQCSKQNSDLQQVCQFNDLTSQLIKCGRGQENILEILFQYESMSQKQLQEVLGIEAGSLSEILSKLEQRQFIERYKDINDKRKSIIHLTSLGKEKIKHKKSNDEDMFDMLTSIEQQQLNDMLNKVLKEWYRRHMKYHKTK